MKKKNWEEALITAIVAIGIVGLSAALVWAAGSVTLADVDKQAGQNIYKVSWVADNATSLVPVTNLDSVRGFVYQVITDPGSPAPTANYDIYLIDAATGAAISGTNLENRHTTTSESVALTTPVFSRSTTFSIINNAVSDAAGDIYIFTYPDGNR